MSSKSQIDIHKLLQTMVEKQASDLHLTVNSAPCLRVNGHRPGPSPAGAAHGALPFRFASESSVSGDSSGPSGSPVWVCVSSSDPTA